MSLIYTGRFCPIVDINRLEQAVGRYPPRPIPQQVRFVEGQD